MKIISPIKHSPQKLLALLLAASFVLAACGGGETTAPTSQATPDNTPNIRMELPASLTGEPVDSNAGTTANLGFVAAANSNGTGEPCAYLGGNEQDPFRNGYNITKLLVSAIATWSCIGDLLIDISNFVPHDGKIYETENDINSPSYKPEDPTHYLVEDNSDNQTTIRLYYGYDRNTPPVAGDDPQFYISWNEAGDDIIEGKLIFDARYIENPDRNPEDPVMMRMDFLYTGSEKKADMFLRFDDNNPWAEGFRIHVVKQLEVNPLQQVYTARGYIKTKQQFHEPVVDTVTEVPDIYFYTVANRAGDGAAIANFSNIYLPLELNQDRSNHLGHYLFTKIDTYYFDDRGQSDWINKTVSESAYRGGRTTQPTGGSWVPFDPSLQLIKDKLNLGDDYFTGLLCGNFNTDSSLLLNSIFAYHEDPFGQELNNQDSEPTDWRSVAISTPDYLSSVYPNGIDWSGAFDFEFTPAY